MPCVAVVLPVFNGETHLRAQIDSILAQSGVEVRVYVLDDASTDRSVAILRDVAQHDARVVVRSSSKNEGHVAGIRSLLAAVTEPYWALADQDDVWDADKLARLVEHLSTTGSSLVYSDVRLIDSDDRVTAESYFVARSIRIYEGHGTLPFIFSNPAVGHTMLGTAAVAREASLRLRSGVVHHEPVIAAVGARLGRVGCLRQATGGYRVHSGNQVGPRDRSPLRRLRALIARPEVLERRQRARAVALDVVADFDPSIVQLARAYEGGTHAGPVRAFRVARELFRARHELGIRTVLVETLLFCVHPPASGHPVSRGTEPLGRS